VVGAKAKDESLQDVHLSPVLLRRGTLNSVGNVMRTNLVNVGQNIEISVVHMIHLFATLRLKEISPRSLETVWSLLLKSKVLESCSFLKC